MRIHLEDSVGVVVESGLSFNLIKFPNNHLIKKVYKDFMFNSPMMMIRAATVAYIIEIDFDSYSNVKMFFYRWLNLAFCHFLTYLTDNGPGNHDFLPVVQELRPPCCPVP